MRRQPRDSGKEKRRQWPWLLALPLVLLVYARVTKTGPPDGPGGQAAMPAGGSAPGAGDPGAEENHAASGPVKDAACRYDLSCYVKKHEVAAAEACRIAVERLALLDYRWENAWYERKFRVRAWADRQKGRLRFAGDAISFQNRLGRWIRHHYVCVYDPKSDSVTSVDAGPGRYRF